MENQPEGLDEPDFVGPSKYSPRFFHPNNNVHRTENVQLRAVPRANELPPDRKTTQANRNGRESPIDTVDNVLKTPDTEIEMSPGCCTFLTGKVEPKNDEILNEIRMCDIWRDEDIGEGDKDEYIRALQTATAKGTDDRSMSVELHHCAYMDFTKRLSAVCQMMKKTDLDLSSLRGDKSETALHTALMTGSKEAARILMESGGTKLISAQYTQPESYGTTALHIAILRGFIEIIDRMLKMFETNSPEKIAFLHQLATGSFYKKESFHFSQLPLNMATWTGNREIFDLLLEHGAQLDKTCPLGSNIVHSLVKISKFKPDVACSMYKYIMSSKASKKWWCNRTNAKAVHMESNRYSAMKYHLLLHKNDSESTPLMSAASVGACRMFQEIVNTEGVYRFTQWQYGPVRNSYYDMTEIDSTSADTCDIKALEVFIFSGETNALSLLNSEPLRKLVDAKYNSYFWRYHLWFLVHFIIMCLFTGSVYHRPLKEISESNSTATVPKTLSERVSNWYDILQLTGCTIVAFAALIYLIVDVIDTKFCLESFFKTYFGKRSWIPPYVSLRFSSFRIMCAAFEILTLIWYGFDLYGNTDTDIVSALSLTSGWMFCFFFLQGSRSMGFLVVMIQRILFGDILRFCLIFAIIITAFTIAFIAMFQESKTGLPDELKYFGIGGLNVFKLMVGLTELDILDKARNVHFTSLLYVMYVLLMNITILNMLIAALSDTYAAVTEDKENLYRKLRSSASLLIERRTPSLMKPKEEFVRHQVTINGRIEERWFMAVEEVNFDRTELGDDK